MFRFCGFHKVRIKMCVHACLSHVSSTCYSHPTILLELRVVGCFRRPCNAIHAYVTCVFDIPVCMLSMTGTCARAYSKTAGQIACQWTRTRTLTLPLLRFALRPPAAGIQDGCQIGPFLLHGQVAVQRIALVVNDRLVAQRVLQEHLVLVGSGFRCTLAAHQRFVVRIHCGGARALVDLRRGGTGRHDEASSMDARMCASVRSAFGLRVFAVWCGGLMRRRVIWRRTPGQTN